MISFVIPAHNEQSLIGRTLAAVRDVAIQTGQEFEIVVANDSSTDRTREIAAAAGARVIDVTCRQIAGSRNAGAQAAQGEVIFFVDADTIPTVPAVREALAAIQNGAAGGGCLFSFDCPMPWWAKILHPVGITAGRCLGIVGGCCMFCTRTAFDAIGGFDEQYFAGEEVVFARRLRRHGPFMIPRARVITSGRKLSQVSVWKVLKLIGLFVFFGLRPFRQRDGLDLWYGPR